MNPSITEEGYDEPDDSPYDERWDGPYGMLPPQIQAGIAIYWGSSEDSARVRFDAMDETERGGTPRITAATAWQEPGWQRSAARDAEPASR